MASLAILSCDYNSNDFSASVIDMLYSLGKEQSSFYEIRSLAICINIKAFNRINRKQLKILKTFLECLKFDIIVY